MFEKTEWTVTNDQSRNTGNIRHKSRNKTTLEKTDRTIKNRQPRDMGNISHKTQNKDIQKATQKKKNMSNTEPTKGEDEPRCSRRKSSSCFL